MKLSNYFFSDLKGRPLIPEEGQEYCVTGEVYDRPGFTDGTAITTSFIAARDENSVNTKSGSVYVLGEMSPDYEEMLEANEAGVPIGYSWILRKDHHLLNKVPKMGEVKDLNDVLSAPVHTGLVMECNCDSKKSGYVGEVICQNGNKVTLKTFEPTKNDFEEKDVEIFVVWPSYDFVTEAEIRIGRSLAGIPYEEFQDSFLRKCRPVILN